MNIRQPSSSAMLRNCVWALSNFFRGKPQPHIDVLRPALPVLAQVLAQCQETECLQDAGWALSYISDGDNERIQAVIDAGVGPDLVRHLGHAQANVVTPMLRTLGNLVSGDDGQTQGELSLLEKWGERGVGLRCVGWCYQRWGFNI
jgi:importin subunit alpha-6/7